MNIIEHYTGLRTEYRALAIPWNVNFDAQAGTALLGDVQRQIVSARRFRTLPRMATSPNRVGVVE
jgi:hypothetical protein